MIITEYEKKTQPRERLKTHPKSCETQKNGFIVPVREYQEARLPSTEALKTSQQGPARP